MTLSRLSMQKSMSKSGIDILSGLINLSKRRLCSIGSNSVIPNANATNEPAPDPRPGPTGISFDFDHKIKSATIKK